MSKKYRYVFAVVLVTVAIYVAEKYVDKTTEAYPASEKIVFDGGSFGSSLLPASTTGEVITHTTFTLSYSEAHEQAEWVAYALLPSHLSRNEFERPLFVEDRSVPTKSAHWRNYKRSGYDRGHLCPAGDRRFSFEAYHETFLTSNISPQNHDFNSGIWNRLEQKVRRWAKENNGVYVVTGGVLSSNLESIGFEEVSVPQWFYKIVLTEHRGDYTAIAFLVPNQPSSASYFEFAVPVDTVEARTGIDFFPNFPDELESKLESGLPLDFWQ